MSIDEIGQSGALGSEVVVGGGTQGVLCQGAMDNGWFDAQGEVMVEVPAIVCSAGLTPSAVYAAVAADNVTTHPGVIAAGGSDCGHAPVPVLSCSELQGLGYAQRIERLVAAAADQLTSSFGQRLPDVVAMLPADAHRVGRAWHVIRHGTGLSPAQGQLIGAMPMLSQSHWWSVPLGCSCLSVLAAAAREIAAGVVDSVLIVGVDACAADAVVADPELTEVRRNTLQAHGLAPADALGLVLLSRRRGAKGAVPGDGSHTDEDGGDNPRSAAIIRCSAPVKDMSKATSWAESLASLLNVLPQRWDAEISLFGALAAEQALGANLRRALAQLRHPPELESIAAWRGLGFAGAAGLPLLFGLAIGRLVAGNNPINRVLALYGGAGTNSAGGIVLESAANAREGS